MVASLRGRKTGRELAGRGALLRAELRHLRRPEQYDSGHPGEEVAAQSDWQEKLEEITRRAADWGVGIVTGVPSWVQPLFGRLGGQNKCSRVLAGERLEDWLAFTAGAATAREHSRR